MSVGIAFPDATILAFRFERRYPKRVGDAVEKAIATASAMVEATAKKSFLPRAGKKPTPNPLRGAFTLRVRTGQLRRSIRTKKTGKGFNVVYRVGSGIVYAPIHETGGRTKHANIPARPYMRPSLERNVNRIRKIVVSAVRAAMEASK